MGEGGRMRGSFEVVWGIIRTSRSFSTEIRKLTPFSFPRRFQVPPRASRWSSRHGVGVAGPLIISARRRLAQRPSGQTKARLLCGGTSCKA